MYDAVLQYASNLQMSLFGTSSVDVEGHGRDGPLDVSTTVGWFTSIDHHQQDESCGTFALP